MKLSDAILLGSTMKDSQLSNANFCTCLVGTSLWAFGRPVGNPMTEFRRRWPWAIQEVEFPGGSTLTCKTDSGVWAWEYALTKLCSLMLNGEWTLDQAVDWIRAHEPADEVSAQEESAQVETVNADER